MSNRPIQDHVDRFPPYSSEAEQGALGCFLLDPNETLVTAGAECDFTMFYDLRHQVLFEALSEMSRAREHIDLITVSQKLDDKKQLEAVGGRGYLSALQDATPSSANFTYYLRILRDKRTLRRILKITGDYAARVYEAADADPQAIAEAFERDVLELTRTQHELDLVPFKDLVRASVDRLQERFQSKGSVQGLPTGFVELDRMIGGLKPAELIVLAARPSVGKTAIGMNIAEHLAINCKVSVGVFSLEMTRDALVDRMFYGAAGLTVHAVANGNLTEGDFRRATAASGRLSKGSIWVDHTAELTSSQIRSRARRMYSKHGCKVFIIDYLQYIRTSLRQREDNRERQVSEISASLKALAKELNVPVVVLAQLNRDMEKDKTRKPRLSDLRESGSIEQDADVVGLLYNVRAEEETELMRFVNLLIAKQRNGPTGDINLLFRKQYTKFESLSKLEP